MFEISDDQEANFFRRGYSHLMTMKDTNPSCPLPLIHTQYSSHIPHYRKWWDLLSIPQEAIFALKLIKHSAAICEFHVRWKRRGPATSSTNVRQSEALCCHNRWQWVVGRATRTQRGDNSECASAHTGCRCLRVCRCTCLCKYACHLYIRPLNSSNTHQLSHHVCTCPHLTGSTVQFITVCVPVYMNLCSWYILTSIYASIINYHITHIISVSCSFTKPQTASRKRKRKEQKNKNTKSRERQGPSLQLSMHR